jgi:kumamolisin
MPARPSHVPLAGSERQPLHGARVVGPAANERIEVTVRVRPRSDKTVRAKVQETSAKPPGHRRYLTREEFAAQAGAAPADLAKIEAFAENHNLAVVEKSIPRRTVVLSGNVADFSHAFGVTLVHYEHPGGSYRGRTGPVNIPADLADIVEGVFGLDDRPQARPHFQRQHQAAGLARARANGSPFTPPQLAKLYDFPTDVDGTGQCIAIIELGGGYRLPDLQTYFSRLGLPTPTVEPVLVDHAHNHPTTPDGADGEVMLDIEVAGAVAPKAKIVVYFAPNTDAGFLDAITTAIHDTDHNPSAISISWGGPESNWTAQAMQQMDQAFQAAAALGITVCVAAGDNGSGDGVPDGQAHVDFPASSPFALACGGTKLVANGSSIASETVWHEATDSATGGGVSDAFGLPDWQKNANVPPSVNPGARVGRGVPDVCGDADPETGYEVRVDGQDTVIGGTSAVAPLWTGLVALLNQSLGKPVGYLNPVLYNKAASGAFHDITAGNNGDYQAGPGWDACTGLGSPDGSQLLKALGGKLGGNTKRTSRRSNTRMRGGARA